MTEEVLGVLVERVDLLERTVNTPELDVGRGSVHPIPGFTFGLGPHRLGAVFVERAVLAGVVDDQAPVGRVPSGEGEAQGPALLGRNLPTEDGGPPESGLCNMAHGRASHGYEEAVPAALLSFVAQLELRRPLQEKQFLALRHL